MKKRKEKRKYVARPGIEPRIPDLRVRCPTDRATRPGFLYIYKSEILYYMLDRHISQLLLYFALLFVGASILRCKGTLLREVTLSFTYLLPSPEGFTLKGENLLLLEQILSYESKPQFGRAISDREANRKSQNLLPLVKMTGKYGGVPIHLKLLGGNRIVCVACM